MHEFLPLLANFEAKWARNHEKSDVRRPKIDEINEIGGPIACFFGGSASSDDGSLRTSCDYREYENGAFAALKSLSFIVFLPIFGGSRRGIAAQARRQGRWADVYDWCSRARRTAPKKTVSAIHFVVLAAANCRRDAVVVAV